MANSIHFLVYLHVLAASASEQLQGLKSEPARINDQIWDGAKIGDPYSDDRKFLAQLVLAQLAIFGMWNLPFWGQNRRTLGGSSSGFCRSPMCTKSTCGAGSVIFGHNYKIHGWPLGRSKGRSWYAGPNLDEFPLANGIRMMNKPQIHTYLKTRETRDKQTYTHTRTL